MIRYLKVTCVQIEPKPTIIESLEEAIDLCSNAIKEKTDFLFLPEYCGGITSKGILYNPPSELEEKHKFLSYFKNFCQKNSVWCLIGSIAIRTKNSKIVNRGYIIDANGKIVSKYDKIHMFDICLNGENHNESSTISSGKKAVIVKTDFCKIGHTICYDLRFPNLYRNLSHAGAEILAVPSAFTKKTGLAHWHVLNRARAIENGAFVIAPCSVGKIFGGGNCFGHSLIINPWGEVIIDGGNKRGIISAKIDLKLVKKTRKQLPSLSHDKFFKLKEY